jgi:SecD/SecF fusion protein
MQSKGAVKFFAIIIALACLYQLSFTWVTRHWENNAKDYANGDAVKEKAYLDSISGVPVYNLGFKSFTYRECKENEINLGLDLRGGMNVTMEVSLVDLLRAMSNFSTDPTFNKAIENAVAAQTKSQKDFVTLFGEEFMKLDPNANWPPFSPRKNCRRKSPSTPRMSRFLRLSRKKPMQAFNRTYQILKTRIDKFGVTQPNVQKLGSGPYPGGTSRHQRTRSRA